MGDSLFVDLPFSNRVKSFLAEGVVLDDFPAGPEDGEDLNGHDGNGEPVIRGQFMSCLESRGGGVPLRRNPVCVDGFHGWDVQGDEPHRGRMQTVSWLEWTLGFKGERRTLLCSKRWFGCAIPACR